MFSQSCAALNSCRLSLHSCTTHLGEKIANFFPAHRCKFHFRTLSRICVFRSPNQLGGNLFIFCHASWCKKEPSTFAEKCKLHTYILILPAMAESMCVYVCIKPKSAKSAAIKHYKFKPYMAAQGESSYSI